MNNDCPISSVQTFGYAWRDVLVEQKLEHFSVSRLSPT
jgi:hypothetical protein